MTVGKAIFYLLDNSTDLTAIVGTRIYPEVAQQDAPLPYVVYNISNNEPSDTKREPSKMDTANIEVNCYSTSYTQVIDMSVAVRAALDRVTGTYSGVNVQSIAYMNEVIDFDEGQRAYNVSSDYDVRISRTDFEIAQGSPITGVDLGDLADVNTTGVTDGQVIAYDAATAVWLPATDAGGAEQLNDLSDVIISQPSTGEFFRYDGGEWVNDTASKSDVGLGNVDNTSDANKPVSTATQTALDAKPDNLRQLNDVTISGPATDQVLQYDGADWVNATFSAATSLEDLTDVDIADAPANGSLLEYNLNLGLWQDSGSNRLPTDGVYFHQRYETESEALRTGATATTELYFTCTAQGNGLAESASSDTPTAGKIIRRKIYYSDAGFADPDTGTWVEFTPAPADDASFATVKAALLEYLKARTGGTVPISLKQTWEEVAAAPAFTGLLNETYGSGAEAAYSTRRLNGNVTDCMVIRRASDSTTTTIGFDGEDIDEAAITTFCTGTTCTVYQWLDQSGNGNTATAGATEPIIYTGGAIVKNDGKVGIDFGTAYSALKYTGQDLNLSAITVTIVGKEIIQVNQQGEALVMQSDNNDGFRTHYQDTGARNRTTATNLNVNVGSALNFAVRHLHDIASSTASMKSTFNGVVTATGSGKTFSTNGLDLAVGGSSYSSSKFHGNLSEAILFGVDKYTSGDIASIRENIGDYFTQNTPLLDTYSGAAAAYSLRLLDSTYTGSAIRVRRSSDNTEQDIGFNVFGELDTVSLLAFAGTGSAYVKIFYDQSGNNRPLSQTSTSRQPKIYDSTTGLILENGKPAMDSTAGVSHFRRYTPITLNQPITFFQVGKPQSGTSGFFDKSGSYPYNSTDRIYLTRSSFNAGSGLSYTHPGTDTLITALANGTSSELFLNSSSVVQGDAGSNNYDLGDLGAFGNLNNTQIKYIQEWVIYDSDQDAAGNRAGIETNINTFYNIY